MINAKTLNFLSVIQYGALVLATIGVLIFQFIPHVLCMYLSLGLFALGFFMIMLRSMFTTAEIFIASVREYRKARLMVETGRMEVINTKKERVASIITTLFWLLVFGFALAVFILYIINYPIK